MRIKAILFDLYGTLIERQEKHFVKRVSEYYLQQVHKEKKIITLGSLIFEIKRKLMTTDLSTYTFPREFLSIFASASHTAASEIEQELKEALMTESNSVMLLSGAKAVLSFFRKREYRIGVVSNLSTYHKEPFFKLGLDRYVDATVFSCDLGYAKPDAEIYVEACKQLEVLPEEVVFVGDSYRMDVKAPLSLGMQAIYVSKSGKYPHLINNVSEMGLIMLDDNIHSVRHLINDTTLLAGRKIVLETFALHEEHDERECLIYKCKGSQDGKTREFYLKRYIHPPFWDSSPSTSAHSTGTEDPLPIPVRIDSELMLLIPCATRVA